MEWLLAIAIVWLFVSASSNKRQMKSLAERLRTVEQRQDTAAQQTTAPLAPPEMTPARAAVAAVDKKPQPESPALRAEPVVRAAVPAAAAAVIAPQEISAVRERWRRLEQLFMENWTGILGVAVVVTGVTFIGIYTALRLLPIYRFLMTVGGAGVMAGAAFWLSNRQEWRALSEWLRSAAAAIFLFACGASGGLPGLGLQWIDAPIPALALLVLGISTNLYLSWASKGQTFAWLHVVLSMLPLAIVPQSAVSLGIASIVALFGVGLSFRTRWDQHLLIVIGTYTLYHFAWYLRMTNELDVLSMRLFAACNAIAVFATAALVHYRKDYASQRPETWPLLVHISNWSMLGVCIFLYRPAPSPVRVAALVGAGLIAYALARRARRIGVRWLHVCDTLIGQALVIAGLANLYLVHASTQLIVLAVLLECLLFLRLVIEEPDDVLGKIGWLLANAAAGVFAGAGLFDISKEASIANKSSLLLLVGAAAATGAQSYLTRRQGERMRALGGTTLPPATLGWLVGAITTVGLFQLALRVPHEQMVTMEMGAFVATVFLLLVSKAANPEGILSGAGVAIVVAHAISWAFLLEKAPWDPLTLSYHIGPLSAVALAAIWLASEGMVRQAGIYLLAADLALAAYLSLNPISPVMPGVAWLLLSVVALELANRLQRPSSVSTLLVAYGYLVAFVCAYTLVIIQTQAYIGHVSARMLVELFGLAVIAYWWFFQPGGHVIEHPTWLRAHPFFLELGLVALAVTNVVEVQAQWRPLTWALIALALLLPATVRRLDERLQLYSVVFFWGSVADVAIVMSTFESPSALWYDRPDLMSLAAIVLQVVYVAASHSRLSLAEVRFPYGLGGLERAATRIATRRNLWVYYPFFAGIALFLFWRFDRSLLTLLWVAEAFAMFVLSAALRENQFRHVALAALAICVARLLVVDLAETHLGLRGVIFLTVGLLMLGMNAIYNRYRARFQ